MIPRPVVQFTPPARPADMTQGRIHNRLVKEALRETMELHHSKHTRRHFQKGAKHLYAYAPRTRKYLASKRRKYGHTIDMLASGDTRRAMADKPVKVSIGGAAEGGKKGITATFKLKFPFAGKVQENVRKRIKGRGSKGYVPPRRRNILPQLKKEMERWAGDEVGWAIQEFQKRYMEKVNAWRGRRQRVRKPKK